MNHHPDLTPGVMAGLSWFYLIAAMINSAAAAYIGYAELVSEGASREGLAPKTRSMPDWLRTTTWAFYLLGGFALLISMTTAFWLFTAGSIILSIFSAADAAFFAEHEAEHGTASKPSLDHHQPAVGLGGPLNRAIWTSVWAMCSTVFATMGATYALKAEYAMPQVFRNAIDKVSGPTSFFTISTLAFIALIVYRRFLSSGVVAWACLNLSLLFFGLSMTDYDFRDIVTKPDNVPIIGLIYLTAYFTWLGMRRAVINDARMARGMPNLEELGAEKTLTWPDLVYTELIALVVGTVALILWAIALQAPLEQPASSTQAPNPSKAPWYFLGLQEMLVYYDPWMAGVVLPSLVLVGLAAIPYLDFNKKGNGYYTINQRKFAYLVFQFGFLELWITLIILGTFFRGPNWNIFGPFEYWDPHKVLALNNVDLSQYFWIMFMGQSLPKAPPDATLVQQLGTILLREWLGIVLVLAYFIALPPLMATTIFRGFFAKMGFIRFMLMANLLLFMASLPIKMVLRWTVNLKYIISIPEFFLNF